MKNRSIIFRDKIIIWFTRSY